MKVAALLCCSVNSLTCILRASSQSILALVCAWITEVGATEVWAREVGTMEVGARELETPLVAWYWFPSSQIGSERALRNTSKFFCEYNMPRSRY